MSTAQNIEMRLWDYIDGRLTEEESLEVGEFIQCNPEWKQKYEQLMELQVMLQADQLEEPSMRFQKNVMEEITRVKIAPASSSYINKSLIRGLALFFICSIVAILIYGFAQIDFSSLSTVSPESSNTTSWKINYPSVQWNAFFQNDYINVLLGFNVILGLYLLDQYIQSRRKKWKAADMEDFI